MNREYYVDLVFAVVLALVLSFLYFQGKASEKAEYLDRCACENCRCRCHIGE